MASALLTPTTNSRRKTCYALAAAFAIRLALSSLKAHEPYTEPGEYYSNSDHGCTYELTLQREYTWVWDEGYKAYLERKKYDSTEKWTGSHGYFRLSTIYVSNDRSSCGGTGAGCSTPTLDAWLEELLQNGTDLYGGVNKFQIYNGSAERRVPDLTIPGVANHVNWSWVRFHNTVIRGRDQYMGVGGCWRHSWQYELLDKPKPKKIPGGVQKYAFVTPSGDTQEFLPTGKPGEYAVATPAKVILVPTDKGYNVVNQDKTTYKFVRTGQSEFKDRQNFRLDEYVDSHGLATKLEYNDLGLLTKVTEPAGHWYALSYEQIAYDLPAWRRFGFIEKEPAKGEWVEIEIPAELRETEFRYLWISGRAGKMGAPASLAVAGIEFYAPGSDKPLSGHATGTGENPEAAYDHSAETIFAGENPRENFCVLDLGKDHKSRIAKVRVLAAPGQEHALVGASLAGLVPKSKTCNVIKKVVSDFGHEVVYNYELLTNPITQRQYPVLAGVDYGEGIKANYRYIQQSPNATPVLALADDPMYPEMAKKIKYTYQNKMEVEDTGVIYQEIDPETGVIYATYERDPSKPEYRAVRYVDGKTDKYIIPENTFGRPIEHTDAAGRVSRLTYADNGKGVLTETVKGNGVKVTLAYDKSGKVASYTSSDGRKFHYKRDEAGRALELVNGSGRKGQDEWSPEGYLLARKPLEGGEYRYECDRFGRVKKYTDNKGIVYNNEYDDRGLLVKSGNDEGGYFKFEYDRYGQQIAVVTPDGKIRRTERNSRGLATKVVDTDGKWTAWEYDAYGRMISEKTSDGKKQKLVYDGLSRLVERVDGDGKKTTYEYGSLTANCAQCGVAQQPTRIVSPDGIVTKFTYDIDNRVVQRVERAGSPDEQVYTMTYDTLGNMTTVADGRGRTTRYTYDDVGRRVSTTKPSGETIILNYDEKGEAQEVRPDEIKNNKRAEIIQSTASETSERG